MTLRELSKYYRLHERYIKNLDTIKSLSAAASPGAQVLTGMPHAPGISDKVGDLAVEIAELEDRNKSIAGEMEAEAEKLERFIRAIDDDRTRLIYRLRFLRCLQWNEVAEFIGGHNTAHGVKSACYRYLKSCNAVTHDDA